MYKHDVLALFALALAEVRPLAGTMPYSVSRGRHPWKLSSGGTSSRKFSCATGAYFSLLALRAG